MRHHFRGSVLVALCPAIISGAGSLTRLNEVSLERCPGQAWTLDGQTELPNTFHTGQCESSWDTSCLRPGRWGHHSWEMAMGSDL